MTLRFMSETQNDVFPLLEREDALVNELRVNVSKALREWNEDAIHQARVATRRLTAALNLMKPVLSRDQRRPFAHVLRKLRRRLGPLRDLDVMIGHLEQMAPRNRRLRPAIAWLCEKLQQSRVEARAHSQERGSATQVLGRLGTWWGVREEVLAARAAIDTLLAEQLHLQLDSFAEQADRLVAGSRPSTPSRPPLQTETPTDPHELRIAGKALRYTLEMAEIEGHNLPKKTMKAFKQMQELLGLWHDYVVLSERAMQVSLDALLPHHNAALQADVLDLAKNLLNRSAKHLAEFAALWSQRGQELSASIRENFPLTRPVVATEPAVAPTPEEVAAESVVAPEHEAAPESEVVPEPEVASEPATASQQVTAPQTDPGPPDSAENPPQEASVPDAASTVQA